MLQIPAQSIATPPKLSQPTTNAKTAGELTRVRVRSTKDLLEQRQPKDERHAPNDHSNHRPRPKVVHSRPSGAIQSFLRDWHTRPMLAAWASSGPREWVTWCLG